MEKNYAFKFTSLANTLPQFSDEDDDNDETKKEVYIFSVLLLFSFTLLCVMI